MGWTSPWERVKRRRIRRAAGAAQAVQDAEYEAARRRLLAVARRNAGPGWNAPTVPLPVVDRPLLTPGQRWRGSGARR